MVQAFNGAGNKPMIHASAIENIKINKLRCSFSNTNGWEPRIGKEQGINNMTCKLSICIPTYNRASYLDETLKYIVKQILEEDEEVEIVISDNGSNDGTVKILENYSSKYGFIRYYCNTKNLGYDLNLIKTIENANGEYVWAFSDDDIIQDKALKKVLNLIKTYKPNYICLNYDQFVTVDSKIHKIKLGKEFKNFNLMVKNDLFYLTYKDILNITPATWTSFLTINVFRKELLNLEFIKSKVDRVKAWSQLLMLAQATERGGGLITPLLAVSQRTRNSSSGPYVFLKQLPDTFEFIFDIYNIDIAFQTLFFKRLSNNLLSFRGMSHILSYIKLNEKKADSSEISKRVKKPTTYKYFNFLLTLTPLFLVRFLTKLVRYFKGEGYNLGQKDLEERF